MLKSDNRNDADMVYHIWLTKIKGLGPVKQRKLLSFFRNAKDIYIAEESELKAVKGIKESDVKEILSNRQLDDAKYILEECQKLGIIVVGIQDELYPVLARDLSDMPILLYCKGTIINNLSGVAVIGSRRCSRNGKEKTIAMAEKLATEGIPVISGMAKGIDS